MKRELVTVAGALVVACSVWVVGVLASPPKTATQLIAGHHYPLARMLGHRLGVPLGLRSHWVLLGDSRLALMPAAAWPEGLAMPTNVALAGGTAHAWRELLPTGLPLLAPDSRDHVVLWLGVNDMQNSGRPPNQVLADLLALAGRISPQVRRVSVLEQVPLWRPDLPEARNRELARAIDEFNAQLAAARFSARNAQRVALFARFADAQRRPNPAFFTDGLHLSDLGYAELLRAIGVHGSVATPKENGETP